MSYSLAFASIPFATDKALLVRMPLIVPKGDAEPTLPFKHQPLPDFIQEIDRLWPFLYLDDFQGLSDFPGRNLSAIARDSRPGDYPNPCIRIGDWYYPNTASRWSVFRGLATSTQAKAMLASTQGSISATFGMNDAYDSNNLMGTRGYSVASKMFMLPPRCIGETAGTGDGLYLITLVDERYFWQTRGVNLKITRDTTWASLLDQIGVDLGISIGITGDLSIYGKPEADSQLWANQESASALLDAIASNLGRVVVRLLSGAYDLYTPEQGQVIANISRGDIRQVLRTAGGDIFQSGGNLPIGSLFNSKNAVTPSKVVVTFPKYVEGDSPVPHFVNSRYQTQRPSSVYEESVADVYSVEVPISSGGSSVAGLTGVSTNHVVIHDTAKALLDSEASTIPNNLSGLVSLGMQITNDYYDGQAVMALDEIYPGLYRWVPDGIHDIVWNWSARTRQACTRVFRPKWNKVVRENQHSTPAVSGYSNVPKGVGGPSVAQTWRDGNLVNVSVPLFQDNTTNVVVQTPRNLPTQNRWKGRIDNEILLFEGTSGGISTGNGYRVDVVYRPIDGTLSTTHVSGASLAQIIPDNVYGANLVSQEKMGFAFPKNATSGGISEVVIPPPLQTVRAFSNSGLCISGVIHYSGAVYSYDPTASFGNTFQSQELVWLVDRNNSSLRAGKQYDGQLAGHSPFVSSGQTSCSGIVATGDRPSAPVYLVSEAPVSPVVIASGLCPAISLQEERMRCEKGLINIYARNVLLFFQNGCLQRVAGAFSFARREGCCECGSGSGSGSGSGCIPGICEHCTNPPFKWKMSVNGFQGQCTVFNRDWELTQAGACVWRATFQIGLLTVSVTLTILSANTFQIVFTYGPDGIILNSATYTGFIQTNQCCASVTGGLTGTCNCGVVEEEDGDGCEHCGKITPETFVITYSGFTGCFDPVENESEILTRSPDSCIWISSHARLVLTGTNWVLTLTIGDNTIVYILPINDPRAIDCCANLTLNQSAVITSPFCKIGDESEAPESITLIPDCTSQAPPNGQNCPLTIGATPTCCPEGSGSGSGGSGSGSGSGSGGGGTIQQDCCPEGELLPETIHATVTNLTDDCVTCFPQTSWALTWDGFNTWGNNDPFITQPCTPAASTRLLLACGIFGTSCLDFIPSLDCGGSYSLVSCSCSPLQMIYDFTFNGSVIGCCGTTVGGTARITFTE